MQRSGAGNNVILHNREALDAFIVKNYPSGLEGIQGTLTSRSKAVAHFRDSKRSRVTGPLMILLRGFGTCELRAGNEGWCRRVVP